MKPVQVTLISLINESQQDIVKVLSKRYWEKVKIVNGKRKNMEQAKKKSANKLWASLRFSAQKSLPFISVCLQNSEFSLSEFDFSIPEFWLVGKASRERISNPQKKRVKRWNSGFIRMLLKRFNHNSVSIYLYHYYNYHHLIFFFLFSSKLHSHHLSTQFHDSIFLLLFPSFFYSIISFYN